jgi:hypothetical protein
LRDGPDGSEQQSAAPHCAVCGDRIGVYEPAIWMLGEATHATSWAASPELATAHDAAFHVGCYTAT